MSAGIIWLASYPKSGNTWFRVFLANLRGERETPADINALETDGIASGRSLFDEMVGISAADLREEEIERLRPQVYEHLAAEAEETLFIKIHDAYTRTPDGAPLIPPSVTAGVVYLLRNPLDVAVSYAHHLGCGVEEAIERMADPHHTLCGSPGRLHHQLRQRLGTWSGHVLSWVDAPGLRLHLMRYEEMKRRPMETFQAAARFCGLPEDPVRIERALRLSDFAELQRQEQAHGFYEKPPRAAAFFRRGEVGAWREALTQAQVCRIIRDHGTVMARFGYLDAADRPVGETQPS